MILGIFHGLCCCGVLPVNAIVRLNMTITLPPVAICTICRATTHTTSLINMPCNKRIDSRGKRCNGCFGSALVKSDWDRCQSCEAKGRINQSKCEQCNGDGWIYIRC